MLLEQIHLVTLGWGVRFYLARLNKTLQLGLFKEQLNGFWHIKFHEQGLFAIAFSGHQRL